MNQRQPECPADVSRDSPVPLESILSAEELQRRGSRPADYAAENRALVALTRALAESPRTILQSLAETMLGALKAGSAGVSLLTTHDHGPRFYSPAIAGEWQLAPTAPAKEALLIPFYVQDKAVGTLWALAHDERRRFDAEDLRQLVSLGRFASAAHQMVSLWQVEDSRRAALNLMEDAVQAHQALANLNAELRLSEERYRTFTEQVRDYAIFSTDVHGRATTWNRGVQRVLGFEEKDFLGQNIVETIFTPEDIASGVPDSELASAAEQGSASNDRWMRRKHGKRFFANGVTTALKNDAGELIGFTKVMRDMTERMRAESLMQCQKDSLELLVKGEPLEQILNFLARSMESQSEGRFLVAIHLMEADGYHFGAVAAPSLPASYAQSTRGMDARLELGPCSSAVMSHTPTIVRDLAVETRWPAFAADMVSLGVHGCFTSPILSSDQRTLGTFALYYREPRDPCAHDQQLVDLVTSTVAVAIERRQSEAALRESEDRFRTMTDNISQLAWMCDRLGNVTWYNKRWLEYTGMTFEELQGWGWRAVQHPDHADRVVQGVEHAQDTGEIWEDTFPLRARDGSYRWFLTRALPIRDAQGKVVRWFGTNTDVTVQREMEIRIQQQAAQLADDSRRKDEFLAMLSHELRNPLAPIRSALHLLRLQERGSENRLQQQAFDIIERQVGNLTKLVSDLLEVSRVVSGRIRLEQQIVDLRQVVRHATETIKPLTEQRRHELVLNLSDEPVWINADATRMEEVFVNLLSNAAKYTDEGGRIEVHCELVAEGEHAQTRCAQVRVRDNGVGIDSALLPRIFDLFTQADRSLARSSGGLGIGLSLAQRLVQMHGGTLEAHSPAQDRPDGRGSEFIVKLPPMHAPEAREPMECGAETTPQRDGMRVLVVDDNVDQATMLASNLQHLGYSVQSAHTGPEGLDIAVHWRPDIVVLDIGLPGIDGYEVARRLRSDPGMKTMRLIAVTGYARDVDIARSHEAGFDAHLCKPLEISELSKLMLPTRSQ